MALHERPLLEWNLIGHEKNKRNFLKAIQEAHLPSSHLFVGPGGVGKRTFALKIAMYLLCDQKRACGQCGPCLRVLSHQSESLLSLQPQGQSIKVHQAQEVLEFLSLAQMGPARVIIIDQFQKMTVQGANLLLKTLEEPPKNTYFFLITPTLQGLLPTIKSRCLLTQFGALTEEELKRVLKNQKIDHSPWLIPAAQGSVSKALHFQENHWEDVKKSYEKLWQYFFKSLKNSQSMITPIKEDETLWKDRQFCQSWGEFLLGHLNFCWKLKNPHFCCDFQKAPYSISSDHDFLSLNFHQLDQLFVQALQLNRDFQSNVDSSLSLNHFFIEAKGVFQ